MFCRSDILAQPDPGICDMDNEDQKHFHQDNTGNWNALRIRLGLLVGTLLSQGEASQSHSLQLVGWHPLIRDKKQEPPEQV